MTFLRVLRVRGQLQVRGLNRRVDPQVRFPVLVYLTRCALVRVDPHLLPLTQFVRVLPF